MNLHSSYIYTLTPTHTHTNKHAHFHPPTYTHTHTHLQLPHSHIQIYRLTHIFTHTHTHTHTHRQIHGLLLGVVNNDYLGPKENDNQYFRTISECFKHLNAFFFGLKTNRLWQHESFECTPLADLFSLWIHLETGLRKRQEDWKIILNVCMGKLHFNYKPTILPTIQPTTILTTVGIIDYLWGSHLSCSVCASACTFHRNGAQERRGQLKVG